MLTQPLSPKSPIYALPEIDTPSPLSQQPLPEDVPECLSRCQNRRRIPRGNGRPQAQHGGRDRDPFGNVVQA